MSDSFFNPSEIRLLDVGDSDVYVINNEIMIEGVTVRVQGENKLGGVKNDYYTLCLCTRGGETLARSIAEEDFDNNHYYTKDDWNKDDED